MMLFNNLNKAMDKYPNAKICAKKGRYFRRRLHNITQPGTFYICLHNKAVQWNCGCSVSCDCCKYEYECPECAYKLTSDQLVIPFILIRKTDLSNTVTK